MRLRGCARSGGVFARTTNLFPVLLDASRKCFMGVSRNNSRDTATMDTGSEAGRGPTLCVQRLAHLEVLLVHRRRGGGGRAVRHRHEGAVGQRPGLLHGEGEGAHAGEPVALHREPVQEGHQDVQLGPGGGEVGNE